MIRDEPILRRVGNYYLQKCDAAYEMFSGYTYIVCYQPPTLCQPKQLKGFHESQREQADAYLHAKARAGTEEASFQRTKKRVLGSIAKGHVPCEVDDVQSRLHLMRQGYKLVRSDRRMMWFAPPAKQDATLFGETPNA